MTTNTDMITISEHIELLVHDTSGKISVFVHFRRIVPRHTHFTDMKCMGLNFKHSDRQSDRALLSLKMPKENNLNKRIIAIQYLALY